MGSTAWATCWLFKPRTGHEWRKHCCCWIGKLTKRHPKTPAKSPAGQTQEISPPFLAPSPKPLCFFQHVFLLSSKVTELGQGGRSETPSHEWKSLRSAVRLTQHDNSSPASLQNFLKEIPPANWGKNALNKKNLTAQTYAWKDINTSIMWQKKATGNQTGISL